MKITIPKNSENKNIPTNYYAILDLSGSMHGAISELKETLLSINDLVGSDDTISIGWFSSVNEFDWVCKGLKIKGDNLKKLVNEKIYARNLTCFGQILESLESVAKDVSTLTGNTNNSLYFMTDGWNNSGFTDTQVLSICSKLKGTIHNATICGFGNYYNRSLIIDMANKIGGKMSHISNYKGMKDDYQNTFKGKKTKKNIKIDQKYDFVWQVNDTDILPLEQNKDHSVDVLDTKNDSSLFAINLKELDSLDVSDKSAAFNYSLAYVLSQNNKANLGVNHLRRVGAALEAKMLQKAFTVAQKGTIENELKNLAISGGNIRTSSENKAISLNSFLSDIKSKLGSISIDLDHSVYNAITKKSEDISKVVFKNIDKKAKIVEVTGNENRPNVNFLTVREGNIIEITDIDLKARVDEFNKTAKTKIQLPISAPTFRNYTFVSNGDFNFDKFVYEDSNIGIYSYIPATDIDIFDEEVKTLSIKDFVNLYKTLIKEKAHVSVLNFYIKKYAETKQLEDQRVIKYGAEGAKLLEEMGLDYAMRYAPKRGSKAKESDDADYVPTLAIKSYLDGASTISASKSYEKYLKRNEPKTKKNVADEICWPLFDAYEYNLGQLGDDFVAFCQTGLKGIEMKVDLLSSKLSQIKFYMISTNSWFNDIDKSDEFIYDGLVVQVKEEKEYI